MRIVRACNEAPDGKVAAQIALVSGPYQNVVVATLAVFILVQGDESDVGAACGMLWWELAVRFMQKAS